jgi:hypothetical protein
MRDRRGGIVGPVFISMNAAPEREYDVWGVVICRRVARVCLAPPQSPLLLGNHEMEGNIAAAVAGSSARRFPGRACVPCLAALALTKRRYSDFVESLR